MVKKKSKGDPLTLGSGLKLGRLFTDEDKDALRLGKLVG